MGQTLKMVSSGHNYPGWCIVCASHACGTKHFGILGTISIFPSFFLLHIFMQFEDPRVN